MVFAFCAVVFYTIKILLEARLGKNLWSDASGIAMLTLSAPAARYAITGQFDAALADIYLISAVHFIFGGIFVHLLIIGIKDKARRERGTKVFIAAAMILLTGMVSFYGWIMLAVFLPLYVYIFSGLLKSEARPNFKKTGLQLLAHSFWFLIIIAIYI